MEQPIFEVMFWQVRDADQKDYPIIDLAESLEEARRIGYLSGRNFFTSSYMKQTNPEITYRCRNRPMKPWVEEIPIRA